LVAPKEVRISSAGKRGPQVVVQPIEGNYPAWRQLMIRKDYGPVSWNIAPFLLGKFMACLDALGASSMSIRGSDAADVYHIFCTDLNFIGLLMPMRTSSEPTVPEWAMNPPKPATVEAAA
jgi:hypothetical protein